MENKNKKMIILCILIVIFILVGVIIFIQFGKDDTLDVFLINNKKDNDVKENVKKDDSLDNEVDIDDEYINKNIENENSDNNYEYSEDDVVSYFENMETEVETSTSFNDKFKEYFITIVDFIFYDGEIKEYTFNELSGTAKAKIIRIALIIDNKIEEYVPNYKENISNTSSKVYIGVKEKLITLYMEISTDICSNNEKECNKLKEIFGEIKDVCKIGWDFVKGLFKAGFSKVKEWYEIYSGK